MRLDNGASKAEIVCPSAAGQLESSDRFYRYWVSNSSIDPPLDTIELPKILMLNIVEHPRMFKMSIISYGLGLGLGLDMGYVFQCHCVRE